MERLPFFRDLIERGSASLVHDPGALGAMYIPKIESEQIALLKDELMDQTISLQFDGTTRLGEAVVVVTRHCTASFEIVQRLAMLKTSAKHLKGAQLAALITQLLCTTLCIPPSNVVGLTRDSASVNGKACRRLCQNPLVNAQQLLCICHTLNNAGARASFDVLNNWMTPWLDLVGGRDPHRGAQSIWKDIVAPTLVPGFSAVRWHSKAEIMFVIAQHFDKLEEFLQELDDLEYGDATRKKLRQIYTNSKKELQLQLAAILDLKPIVKETYDLEGDRLEILLVYPRVEALRKLGESIKRYEDGVLPNVQALLRSQMELKPGVEIAKDFPPHGTFTASIIGTCQVHSTLYPGKLAQAYTVRYPSDGKREDLEEDEIRPLIKTTHLAEFKKICDSLADVFDYLEARITGAGCNDAFSCEDMYEACHLLQAFDPSFALNLTPAWVDDLYKMEMFQDLNKIQLKSQLPKYKALASECTITHDSVSTFTAQVLNFWKSHASEIPEWGKAALKTFALSPNSAGCERVFSLLARMFGNDRNSSLADMIQAALFLRYNKRH